MELARVEIYDENITSIFMHLLTIEKQGKSLGKIDDTGLFTCDMDNVPIKWVRLTEEELCFGYSKELYVLPTDADILHSIRIYGRFKSATLYQYSFLDQRIEYDTVYGLNEEIDASHVTIMMPFPYSGIPLLQVGKRIYLEIISENDTCPPPKCEIGYGYLDNIIRSDFNIKHGQTRGVSFLHKNGQKFTVFGVDSYGHSINVVQPDTNESVAFVNSIGLNPCIKTNSSKSTPKLEYQSNPDQETILYENPIFGHNPKQKS